VTNGRATVDQLGDRRQHLGPNGHQGILEGRLEDLHLPGQGRAPELSGRVGAAYLAHVGDVLLERSGALHDDLAKRRGG